MKSALFNVSRDGCDLVKVSVSMRSRRIDFLRLEPPLCVFGVFAGVFFPGVLRTGVFLPGVRLFLGLRLSDVFISFLCGKKLEKML